MKKYLNKKREKILIILFCFIVSFVILMFTSKNSFLYPFNDWVDANAFFTVGKSMFNGIVPYRDLFEQKGPFLYLIYGVSSLISYTSFIGVFIIEVLFWTVGLYYLYKILKMFLSLKTSLLVIPLFTTLITTTFAFTHGGSAEEFTLPFFMITLYYFIRHFKLQEINKWQMFRCGIIAGLVLLIKYTLLGFWIGFTLAIFIDFVMKKDYKKAILYPLILLMGMLVPFLMFIIYFGINHAIGDFIKDYFIINITAYGEKVKLSEKVLLLLGGIGKSFINNAIMLVLMLILLFFIWKLDLPKRGKVLLLVTLFISIFFVYFGLKFYRYYLLFILFFSAISLLIIFSLVDIRVDKLPINYYVIILLGFLILNVTYANFFPNYKEFRDVKKEDLFQYKFANIINKEINATMVNVGYLDCGVYTASGVLPSTYFFENQNIPYENFPENIDSLKEYVKNKDTMFVVYYTKLNLSKLQMVESELFLNYDLISEEEQYFENKLFRAYLFKRKVDV